VATGHLQRIAFVVALVCVSPALALAGPKAPTTSQKSRDAASKLSDVDSAERYYANLDYEDANGIAARVLAQQGLTHDQLVRATRVLALTYATLGKEDQARDAFTTVLAMDPDFQLDPNLSPRVTQPFMEARGFWRGQSVKPGIEVVATVQSSDSAKLVITTRDPAHNVANVNLGYRWGLTGSFTKRPVSIGDSVSILVPAAASRTETRLDYYVEGLDARDGVVFEVGNANAPKSAMVDAPSGALVPAPVIVTERTSSGKSVFASPIFWTVVGVVVAGAVVGGVVLFSPKAPNGATLTSGAQCGANPC
jgi:tetratricopeptide (TPR) repeat protein